eukprot:scaffold34597_cov177-Amphora_coffeaeformis.AAC.3
MTLPSTAYTHASRGAPMAPLSFARMSSAENRHRTDVAGLCNVTVGYNSSAAGTRRGKSGEGDGPWCTGGADFAGVFSPPAETGKDSLLTKGKNCSRWNHWRAAHSIYVECNCCRHKKTFPRIDGRLVIETHETSHSCSVCEGCESGIHRCTPLAGNENLSRGTKSTGTLPSANEVPRGQVFEAELLVGVQKSQSNGKSNDKKSYRTTILTGHFKVHKTEQRKMKSPRSGGCTPLFAILTRTLIVTYQFLSTGTILRALA